MNNSIINQPLRRTLSALTIIAGFAAGVLSAPPKVHANPVPISGTWNLCGHNMWDTFHQAGRNFTIDVYQNQIFFGPMVGTLYITPDDPEHDVVRLAADQQTLVRVHFHGNGTFVGSVLGRTVSPQAIMGYHGQIAPDGSGIATWWLDDPVAGIHGEGTFIGNPPSPNPCEGDGYYVEGTYTGQVQLAP